MMVAEAYSNASTMLVEEELVKPIDDVESDTIEPETENGKIAEILEDLDRLVFKLENHVQEGNGEYVLGYEEAFMKAAEMIKNLIQFHKD